MVIVYHEKHLWLVSEEMTKEEFLGNARDNPRASIQIERDDEKKDVDYFDITFNQEV